MRNAFEEKLVDERKVIDFHTHPYTCRGEYMGMYGEDFYLEPEHIPEADKENILFRNAQRILGI